jgi:hypothetical protein
MNNIISFETSLGVLVINLNVIDVIDIRIDCGCIFIVYNGKMHRITENTYCDIISMTKQIGGNDNEN